MAFDFLLKARRMSRHVVGGNEIIDLLTGRLREALVEAAATGAIPIAAVSRDLLREVGEEALKPKIARQFCGLVVRAVLHEEGYEPFRANIKLSGDPVFQNGTSYLPIAEVGRTSKLGEISRLLRNRSDEDLDELLAWLKTPAKAEPKAAKRSKRP